MWYYAYIHDSQTLIVTYGECVGDQLTDVFFGLLGYEQERVVVDYEVIAYTIMAQGVGEDSVSIESCAVSG